LRLDPLINPAPTPAELELFRQRRRGGCGGALGQLGRFETFCILEQVRRDLGRVHSLGCGHRSFRAYVGFLHILGGREHLLGAKGEAVDFTRPRRPFGIVLERGINAAQDGFERDARVLPGLDQRPVERREQQRGAAVALEMLLDSVK